MNHFSSPQSGPRKGQNIRNKTKAGPRPSEDHQTEVAGSPTGKTYGILMFATFASARSSRELIIDKCSTHDQLNIVIKEEGNMDDPELIGIDPKVKVYAGEAWNLIHERRKEEGWYGNFPKL